MKIKILSIALFFFVYSCGNNENKNPNDIKSDTKSDTKDEAKGSSTESGELIGAGASFPYPLYSKMFSEYGKKNGVSINYQSIGSGGGIRQLMEKTIDFGASDAFLSDEEIKKMPSPAVHIPTCLGSVIISYNLPGNPKIKLTGPVLANIYLGTIKKWDDKQITALNPGIKLPNSTIMVAHRSDGSGTTYIFTDYLSQVSPDWKSKVGTDKAVNWPVGLGGKGNEGVSALVKNTPASIGYIELIYATQNNMVYTSLKNKAGKFIDPSIESTTEAAKGDIPDDTRISLVNGAAEGAYPIASFSWILIYKDQKYGNRDKQKATHVLNLLKWMVHEGQSFNKGLHYAPLPENVVQKADAALKSVTFGTEGILQ